MELYDRHNADALADARDLKSELMDELMRRAAVQNPDLVKRMMEAQEAERKAREERIQRMVDYAERMDRDAYFHRLETRKRFYNDLRPINKLTGLRKRYDYKALPRLEQMEWEKAEYFDKYHLDPPREWMAEWKALHKAKTLRSSGGMRVPRIAS